MTKCKNISSQIFSIIADGILMLLIVIMIAICSLLLGANFNNSLPTFFNKLIITVVSDSMKPDFKKGDTIIVEKISADKLEVGDIIAFYRYAKSEAPSVIWLHRIIDIEEDADGYIMFRTQGDANKLPDKNWTREDYVVGVYKEIGGFWQKLLTFIVSQTGIILMVILPSALIFSYEFYVLIHIFKDYRRGKQDDEFFSISNQYPLKTEFPLCDIETVDYSENKDIDMNSKDCMELNQATDQSNGKLKSFLVGKESKGIALDEVLMRIESLKQKKKIVPRQVMKEAIKLEKIKNIPENKVDKEKRKTILEALNWCYESVGQVKYKTNYDKDNDNKNI